MKKHIHMTKKYLLLLILILSLLPFYSFADISSADTLEVVVHYRRFDEAYENWNIWVWAKDKEGQSYEFSETDAFGKVARFEMTKAQDIDEIGLIVRKGEWEAKDVDSDRFIDTSKINAEGILEVYLIQGTPEIYYDQSEIDLSPRFMKATFIDDGALKLETSMPIKKADLRKDFKIVDSKGHEITPSAISASGELASTFVVLLKEKADVKQMYQTQFLNYKSLLIDQSGLYDTAAFDQFYSYAGALGTLYSPSNTTFRVWSPVADTITLNLYAHGDGDALITSVPMSSKGQGLFETVVSGDQHGVYYTYTVANESTITETYDPYAHAAGVNGDRSMVVDLTRTNPEDWDKDHGPTFSKANDAIVYEMHIRDLSIHASANINNAGKYLGVVEPNTQTDDGTFSGLSHLKELGITHVQILPMFDFNSIDETKLDENKFNWGYDPKNYSVPEGSYSSDPYHGEVRIKELKQMVQGLHKEEIGVIMDVVYNHTALTVDSNLNILAPNYYFRTKDGVFSNASGTGNETASERTMMRKLMLDSLKYWVTEYHVDGFRFDLMGVHDTQTMVMIEKELRALNPNIILYGEGWTGGSSTLPERDRLVKSNIFTVEHLGAFNDDFRDGIKGHVFNPDEAGFANGALGFEESVQFGIVGAVFHPQVMYDNVNYSKKPWANAPSQSVNYVSAHDNLTLWDKLKATNPEASDAQLMEMDKLANAIVLTSQGMPFLHLGVDFLRTKQGDHNSYKSPDTINQIDWDLKTAHKEIFEYYKGLIEIRKAYPALRIASQVMIEKSIIFFDETEASLITLNQQMVGYMIDHTADPVKDETLILLFNGSFVPQDLIIPNAEYKVLVDHQTASPAGIMGTSFEKGGQITLPPSSALVLSTKDVLIKGNVNTYGVQSDSYSNTAVYVLILIPLIGIFAFVIYRKRRN